MNDPLRILVLEDSIADFLLLERHLRKQGLSATYYRVDTYATLDVALQAEWDVLLSDYKLPAMDFRATLQHIRLDYPDLPIILVSGSVGEEIAVELLRLGLNDFVLKDNLVRLQPAIMRTLSETHERRAHKLAEAKWRESQIAALEAQNRARMAALNLMEDAIAARARAEAAHAALQASEFKYRLLAENSSDCIFWMGLDGNFKYISPACEQIFGYTPEEFIGNPALMTDIIHCDDRQAYQYINTSRLGCSSDNKSFEFRIQRKDGSLRWIEHQCQLIFSEKGELLGWHGAKRDITVRKLAEEQLRKLAQAIEQSPESILITNLDHKIEFVNEAFLQTTGYSREEIIGQYSHILHADNTTQAIKEALGDTLRHGAIWKGELTSKRKDDSEFQEFAIITPIRQSNGAITHLATVKENISEKKRLGIELDRYRYHLEELVEKRTTELRQQSFALQALIDNLPHMAWMKDADGRFIAVNKALATTCSISREEMLGKSDLDIFPAAAAERFLAEEAKVIASGSQITLEAPLLGQPDSLYETFKAPIIDADSKVIGTVGFSRNIKPQREMEVELARRAEAAEAASRTKSAFLANMSHEIRTPMNAIIGLTYLLRQSVQLPEQLDRIEKIDAATQHLLSIINDILDLSKIEAGHMNIEHSDFKLGTLMDHVYSLIAEQAQRKGLSFKIDFNDVPQWLRGDLTRLRQALLNYVINAVKFTENGCIRLCAKVLNESDEGLLIRFEVGDSGIGIANDKLPMLFSAFVQADVSTTRRYGGTGLGLSITRGLANLMGGEAGVESKLGQGSVFWFTARLQHGRNEPAIQSRDEQSVGAGEALRRDYIGARLLLAEDNMINREVALGLLHNVGLSADVAENGRVAFEKVSRNSYDIVIMDIQMPEMDGLAATRAIRNILGYTSLPILAMTANAFNDVREECLAAGMNDFVSKPTAPETLYATLLRWLSGSYQPYLPENTPIKYAEALHEPLARPLINFTISARLSAVPGLDSVRGLAHMQGNTSKYLGLLRMFINHHSGDIQRIQEYLGEGNIQEAMQLTHKFKSVADLLGAYRVAELAGHLDTAQHKNTNIADCIALAQSCQVELSQLLEALLTLPETLEAPESPKNAVDQNRLSALLHDLENLLTENNALANDLVRNSADLLHHQLGAHYAKFIHQVDQYDYDDALATLKGSTKPTQLA